MKKKLLTMFLTLILCCTALVGLAGCTSAGDKFVVTPKSDAVKSGDYYVFKKGDPIATSLKDWTFYYPEEKNAEGDDRGMYTTTGTSVTITGLSYKDATAATRGAYKLTANGYKVDTLTEEGEHRTITFIYLGETVSFHYIVTASGTV